MTRCSSSATHSHFPFSSCYSFSLPLCFLPAQSCSAFLPSLFFSLFFRIALIGYINDVPFAFALRLQNRKCCDCHSPGSGECGARGGGVAGLDVGVTLSVIVFNTSIYFSRYQSSLEQSPSRWLYWGQFRKKHSAVRFRGWRLHP